MSSFPFTIGDVARLCNLTVRRENQPSEYISCPFCGRKKMNLHYGKGLYHCPACGEGGSMLKLYSVLRGFQGSKAEIVRAIKKELGITENSYYRFSKQTDKQVEETLPQVDFERMKRLDTVYRAFLNKLFLARIHKPDLYARGLSDEDMERFGFKSVPLFGYKALCRELLAENISLENIGGFYLDNGEWTINLNPKMTGYMIPVYNYFGYIEGIQIRLDRPFGKTKYLWFSSNGLPGGAATAAIPFYMKGTRKSDTLIITEGAFKAIIPNKVFGYSLLALPGVNNIREFEKLLPYIRQDYRQILIAFDADFRINENVAKAKEKLRRLIYESDIYCSTFEWDLSDGKGLDDFALHWIKNRDNAENERSDE